MPWRFRRQIYRLVMAVILLTVGAFLAVRHRAVDFNAIAVAAIAGGLAVLLSLLPGDDDDDR